MQELIFAHCQIPCGIYDDKLRITIINEDLKTISKAMQKIKDLSKQSDPLTQNQINRWKDKKEHHAQNIQNIKGPRNSKHIIHIKIKRIKKIKHIKTSPFSNISSIEHIRDINT